MGEKVVTIFFVAIVLYLLLNKSSDTSTVVKAIGGQITSATAVLQGRDASAGNAG